MSAISSRSVRLQADVDDVGAVADLPAGDFGGLFPFLGGDQVLEEARADDVGALADDEGAVGVFRLDQFDAGIVGAVGGGLGDAEVCPATICAMARMWAGVVPQQPPTRLSQPWSTKFSSWAASESGVSQILAVLVGQAGVGIAGDARARPSRGRVRM